MRVRTVTAQDPKQRDALVMALGLAAILAARAVALAAQGGATDR